MANDFPEAIDHAIVRIRADTLARLELTATMSDSGDIVALALILE